MTFLRVALCLSFALAVACGDDDTSADAGASMDAGAADAPAQDVASADAGVLDAAATRDGGGASDVGVDALGPDVGVDAGPDAASTDSGPQDAGAPDVGVDSGSGCERRVEDRIAGVCDGIGMQICTDWAAENGGGTAVAQCVPADGRCARANTCTDEGCMCGSEPECGDTEMCVSGFAGFSCVCALPR